MCDRDVIRGALPLRKKIPLQCRGVQVESSQLSELTYHEGLGEAKWRLVGHDFPSQNDLIQLPTGDLARLRIVLFRIQGDAHVTWLDRKP